MQEDLKKLLLAAHALRDLSVGYPESEIASSQGDGLQNLLSELLVYLHEQGGLPEDDRDLLAGALDRMPDFRDIDPALARRARLKALKDDGLTIGDCIRVFASAEHGGPDSAYIAAARGLGEDFDMDDDVVVARCEGGGAHVMTWAYISKEDAERAVIDSKGDWVIYNPQEDPQARFWNVDEGWSNLDGATRFSEPPPPSYPLGAPEAAQAGIVCIGSMAPYAVQIKEDESDVDWFECFAESRDHAVEQALDAYPDGKILSVWLTEECPFEGQSLEDGAAPGL